MKKLSFVSFLTTLLFTSCTSPNPTKLVVYIVSDQAAPFILDKYDHLFTGGFRWLIDNGIVFNDAHHNHGNTSTAPGHFALSTGCLLYTSPSPRDRTRSRMPSSA